MALTRAATEDAILRRCDQMMITVGMDGTTRDGTNADLADPIRFGVRDMGFSIADALIPADADLSPIADYWVDRLLDGAELRVLETCWSKWPYVSSTLGTDEQRLSDLADRLQTRISELTDKLKKPYGLELTGGITRSMTKGMPRNNTNWGNRMGWPYR
jgi:hypothetical protein